MCCNQPNHRTERRLLPLSYATACTYHSTPPSNIHLHKMSFTIPAIAICGN